MYVGSNGSALLFVCVLTLRCSIPVEAKPLHVDSHVNGHANPAFLLKKQDSDRLVKKPVHVLSRRQHDDTNSNCF